MARKRMIDPEFWLDEDLAKLSAHARLLFIGTWNICDDNYATFPNKIGWLKYQVFPYETLNIPALLNELSRSGHIIRFVGQDKNDYWYIKNFFKYQIINRPSKPKYQPYLSGLTEYSRSTHPEVNEVNEVKLIKLNKDVKKLKDKTSADTVRENWGSKRK